MWYADLALFFINLKSTAFNRPFFEDIFWLKKNLAKDNAFNESTGSALAVNEKHNSNKK
jgi:hypothetical protein